MIPYYTISSRVGSSGHHEKPEETHKKFNLLGQNVSIDIFNSPEDYPNIPIEWIEQRGHTRFNPFTEISFGKIVLGFGGKNYYFSKNQALGKLLNYILK
jgi:hypothetical protein